MSNPGDTFDRYVIEAVLGEGGMGRVYRAFDPRLGRRVALKVLVAGDARDPARVDAAARMQREARAAAAFSHPNVVAIYDVGEFDGAPFIAMELVSGTTFRAVVGDAGVSDIQKLAWLLDVARGLGSYLVREANSPDEGRYPLFTRSTGKRDRFPLPPDCGSQADRPFEIEPDKGGIAGYALSLLFDATGERIYLDQALQNAQALKANQAEGNAGQSPWPFRADYRTGEGRGPVSGNMTYILRLYDAMLEKGHAEFAAARASLWDWITRYQIPSADVDGALFAQFFEDHDTPTNRTAWAPLNLARYLLERREPGDPDWRDHCEALIDFVRRTFTHREFGIVVCHVGAEEIHCALPVTFCATALSVAASGTACHAITLVTMQPITMIVPCTRSVSTTP